MENRGGERGGIEAHIREDVGDFEQVGQIGFAGAAELVVVALGGDFVGAADHPGVFGGAVLSEFLEEFFEASVKLANGAVAVEAERDFVRRGHVLVYAGMGSSSESGMTMRWKRRVARDEFQNGKNTPTPPVFS
jgi:hypothetical protein